MKSFRVILYLLLLFVILISPSLLRSTESGIQFRGDLAVHELNRFANDILDGNFFAFRLGKRELSAASLLPSAFGYSFFYLFASAFLGLFAGLLLGLRAGSLPQSRLLSIFAFLGVIPDFILAILFMAGAIGFYRLTGLRIARISYASYPARIPPLILPLASMGTVSALYIARSVTLRTREILSSPYIMYARAKGLSAKSIINRHVMAGLMVSLQSDLTRLLALVVGSLFIMERYFNLPGLTRLLFHFGFTLERDFGLDSFVLKAQFGLCLLVVLGLALAFGFSRLLLILLLRLWHGRLNRE